MATTLPIELLINKVYSLLTSDATLIGLLGNGASDIYKEATPETLSGAALPLIDIDWQAVNQDEEWSYLRAISPAIVIAIRSTLRPDSTQDYYSVVSAVMDVLLSTTNKIMTLNSVDSVRHFNVTAMDKTYDIEKNARNVILTFTYDYRQAK